MSIENDHRSYFITKSLRHSPGSPGIIKTDQSDQDLLFRRHAADPAPLADRGLPGDLSSQSRFVRAAFVKLNSVSGDSESESVSQFFHILGSVEQQRGCCEAENGRYEITLYTSCCNASRGIYYYTTYGNRQITAVDMYQENLDSSRLIRYPLIQGEQIRRQN